MTDTKWNERDEYNSLTQLGVVVEDPHFVVRFKGQCYGTERWDSDMIVDALSWQAGCSVSQSRQWEYDNAGEIVDIYDRREEHHCWDRTLGLGLDHLEVSSVDEAHRMSRHRLSVKTRYGDEYIIVGVHGNSSDDMVNFFIYGDDEYATELATALIPNPEDLKEMKGNKHERKN